MRELSVKGFYSWSVFNTPKQMDFNGHLWVRPSGNIMFDPMAMSESDRAQVKSLGGVALCVITNADHTRDVLALQKELGFEIVAHDVEADGLGVPVARRVTDGEQIVPGLEVVHLLHGKTPGEFAAWLPELETVLVGDALQGAPAGALRMPPDPKLADPTRATLELQKILRLPLKNLLVGDGHSLFGNAREAIVACIAKRTGVSP